MIMNAEKKQTGATIHVDVLAAFDRVAGKLTGPRSRGTVVEAAFLAFLNLDRDAQKEWYFKVVQRDAEDAMDPEYRADAQDGGADAASALSDAQERKRKRQGSRGQNAG